MEKLEIKTYIITANLSSRWIQQVIPVYVYQLIDWSVNTLFENKLVTTGPDYVEIKYL